MEATNDQLQTKYQKIASEYSKIRAQANVLKKAVIEEQTRSGELQEQLKEKEVEIRRSEQELDSLTFRNQQLTKRVTVLQEELDEVQNRGKKSRGKSSEKKNAPFQSLPVPNHILDEEFQKKIVENAQLVSQLSDKEAEIIGLGERIDGLETKLDKCEKSRADLENKHRTVVGRLERERLELQGKLSERQQVNRENSLGKQNGDKECLLRGGSARNSNDCETEDSDSGFHQISNQESKPSASSSPRRPSGTRSETRVTEKSVSQEETNEEFEMSRIFYLEKELCLWKAEYNVLKIKYDQLREAEEARNGKINSNNGGDGPVEITNMLGRLTCPFAIPEEIEARENRIKEYYKQQIEELISEKHAYHIKNLAIAADTEIMSIHLETSETKRQKCEEALKDLRTSFTALREDQEVQEGNYKSQLSTISEHLANMNDKLISQTEEIQQLKFELGNKNAKKGKQK